MFDAHKIIAEHGLDEARQLAKTKLEYTCITAAVAMLNAQTSEPAYASPMVTALPHRQPMEGNALAHRWRRQIGFDEYCVDSGVLDDGAPMGIPFGAKARIALIYLHTQAICQGSPVLSVPHSRNAYLKALGMEGGGMSYKLATDQGLRVSACRLAISCSGRMLEIGPLVERFIYDAGVFAPSAPDLDLTNESERIVLGSAFYRFILAEAVKIDAQALHILNNNSWAIDLYIWFASELHRLEAPRPMSWEELAFGSGAKYKRPRQLRATFLNTLQLVKAVYPQAGVELA